MKDTILIVDTVQSDRILLKDMFQREYQIAEAENQKQGTEYLQRYGKDIAIIFLNAAVSAGDRQELLEYLCKAGLQQQIPVIRLVNSVEDKPIEKEYDSAVCDVICKPYEQEIVLRRVRNIIELFQYKKHIEQLQSEKEEKNSDQRARYWAHYKQMGEVICDSICRRNAESVRHIHYVAAYTRILAEHYARLYPRARMTLEKIDMIVQAARMHDVGKMFLPDFIVARHGKLTHSELEILKEHTVLGSQIMHVLTEFQVERFKRICHNVCRYHHERYDGSGYPEGLQKDRIPIEAQLVALADMYDVLVNTAMGEKNNTKEWAYYMLMNGEYGELAPRMRESLKDAKEDIEAFSLGEDMDNAR